MIEKEIVDEFCEQADDLGFEILGREVNLGVGIADIIAWDFMSERLCVIEFKSITASDAACTQVLSYCNALAYWLNFEYYGLFGGKYQGVSEPHPIVVAPGIRGFAKKAWLSWLIDYYEVIESEPIGFRNMGTKAWRLPYLSGHSIIDPELVDEIIAPLKSMITGYITEIDTHYLGFRGGHNGRIGNVQRTIDLGESPFLYSNS